MGKPFKNEINLLASTYEWACRADVSDIAKTLSTTWDLPLLSVGSGGSFSAAEFQANLHRTFFQSLSQAVTPMDLISTLPRNGRASVWFMSASGNNVDIRRAFQHSALKEPKSVSGMVGRENSKLADLASRYQYTNLFEYILPNGRDGFLATNSLFGFSVLLYRAYCEATHSSELLPDTLSNLIHSRIPTYQSIDDILDKTALLWEQDTIHVIYSPALKSAAYDIESKFVEAGLGSIHLSDIRNFAHGRHHWFSKYNTGNGILALTTPHDTDLSLKTLGYLPSHLPKANITLNNDNGDGALVGLLLSIHFTNQRGEQRNIDPGRPGVPSYGSKIYRLTATSGFTRSIPKEKAAIERKTRYGPIDKGTDQYWVKAYRRFIRNISKARIGGIVLDYDGTVVDARRRGKPPAKEICTELVRLLDLGLKVGFATGRGKSIRKELQNEQAIPRRHWKNIIIGYYNGSEIGNLSDDCTPNGTDGCSEELGTVVGLLNESPFIAHLEHEITKRQKQVTIEPRNALPETFLWEVAQDELSQQFDQSTKIVRSSHSIDIIGGDVTKLAVVQKMRAELADNLEILTIGDRGRWPGNDTSLLSEPYSLSVDEVSFSGNCCWNLCPAGVRGPQGTLSYLLRITCNNGIARFK